MKQLIFSAGIIIFIFCAPLKLLAQPDFSDDPYYFKDITYEIGGSLGVMNCLTDLGGGKGIGKKFIKDLNVGYTQPAGSIFFSGVYKNAFVLRSEATWGIVKANDAVLKDVKESTLGRYDRNLSFRSTIFELALISELHPRFFKKYSPDQKMPRLSPYLAGGIGYFVFNPQTKLDGTWVDLQPLRTEGQGFAEHPDRKVYKLKQFNFPVGAGFKYKISSLFTCSAECIYRILLTDYLDDVSTTYIDRSLFQNYLEADKLPLALALYNRQNEINPTHLTPVGDIRGNPLNKDAYFSINFKIAYIF